MQYYGLKSIIASQKTSISLKTTSESFFVKNGPVIPFIQPRFSKIEFPSEKPAILLVSAVGASGKTTTAHALSHETQLPILDLAAHKAVGDNTLTGILTTSYPIEKIGQVLEGLSTGTHCIIIDGIDEGRSKTTEEAFEAFLDDLVNRSKGATSTSIVIFGRGQVLLSAWCYLVDKGADVGLVGFEPFDISQAKEYIDAKVTDRNLDQQQNYERARDGILERLGSAFTVSADKAQDAFLSFIGYPPVLDAVGTLLTEETNYHRIIQNLGSEAGGPIEISLLIRICDYLMRRERENKALPNFIEGIAKDADAATGQELKKSLYTQEEQCARVLCRALGRPFEYQPIADRALNDRYEAAVEMWCTEHPFLDDVRLRNPVFAATAVAHCILSDIPLYKEIALEYANLHRQTFHLLYIMEALREGRSVDIRSFNLLIQSCAEFIGVTTEISIEIEGESWEEVEADAPSASELVMSIEMPLKQQQRTFSFPGESSGLKTMSLGPYLVNAKVTWPHSLELIGKPSIEAVGECNLSARNMRIDATDLAVRSIERGKHGDKKNEAVLFIDVYRAEGHVAAVPAVGGTLQIQCCEHDLDYPLAKFIQKTIEPSFDATVREKYRRLRRIMLEFRSHSKGGLAKYRDKIEHERVLKNALGRNILLGLVQEGILTSDQRFYYVDSDQISKKLGVTWQELKQHKSSEQLERFLNRIR